MYFRRMQSFMIYLSYLFNQTTFVLKRRYPPGLDKKNRTPKPLKTKHFIYELEENTNLKAEPDLKLILTSFVEGGLVFDLFTQHY